MEKYREQIINDICELIKIPSVYEESKEFLFGKAIDDCLNKALAMMDKLGFRTFKAENGAYGYAEIGEGELFGVLGHLDVVNARKEDGWEHDPFEPIVKDGYICGRGAQDDKGPVVIAAYAIKALMDEGYSFKKRVRFIFGTDEENLWRCISEYSKHEEIPASGFAPDSAFPLTYAEKGLLQVIIKSADPSLVSYEGGDSFNAVSSWATCEYSEEVEKALKSLNYDYHIEDNKIIVTGLTAHAKNPWKGVSANLHLLEALQLAGYKDEAIKFVCERLNNKFRFEGFSKEDLSDFSGPVTINLGKIHADENGTVLSVDLRLPVGQAKEDILKLLREVSKEYGLEVEEYDWLRPIHVSLKSELVTNLLKAYREVTKDEESKPYISAGATYARAFDNCVAFGANLPTSATSEHQPNERVSIDALMEGAKIYREAFLKCVVK